MAGTAPTVGRRRSRSPSAGELANALSSDDGNLRELAAKAMHSIVHVKSGLDYWLGDETTLRARTKDILYVYRQETLSADFEAIKSLLALPHASQLPPGFDLHLDLPARQNISEWYAADGPLIAVCEAIRIANARSCDPGDSSLVAFDQGVAACQYRQGDGLRY